DGASYVSEIVVLNELRVCVPRVGLQVDTDRVDASLDHSKRDFACLGGGALVRHHDVGKDKSRQFGAGASELIAHGADRLRRIHAGESEEIKDVAAAHVDAARLA